MNKKHEHFSFAKRVNSFKFAFEGICALVKTQHNFWIHLFTSLCVVTAGFYFKVSTIEWCLLIIVITFILFAEALNTSLEFLCDVVSPKEHPLIKKAKDIAAAAVLIASICALIIGLLIFLPYFLNTI